MTGENVATIEFIQIGKKTTICLLTTENGHEIIGIGQTSMFADNPTPQYIAERDARKKHKKHAAFYKPQWD